MPTALLSGNFGRRDPGDEAVLGAFVDALKGWDLTITGEAPASNNSFRTVKAGAPRAMLSATRSADAIVCAGGPMIADRGPLAGRSSLRPTKGALAPMIASLSPAKYLAFVGVGAGRPPAGKRARSLRRLMAGADLIVVRDEESARALQGHGAPSPLRIGADPSWAVLPEPRARGQLRDSVLLVVRIDPPVDATVMALINIARELRVAGLHVGLLAWRDPDGGAPDVSLVRAIAGSNPGCEVCGPPRDLPEAIELMAGWGAVLSTSFHGVVAGAVAGCACVPLSSSPDMRGLAQTLGCRSISPVRRADEIAGEVLSALVVGSVSATAVKGCVAASEEGFRLLRLVLSGGISETEDIAGLTLGPDRWPS